MRIIPRSRTILLLCIFANALLLFLAVIQYHPSKPEIESLARFVLETGKPTLVPAISLSYFGLPFDDLKFYQLKAVSESGKTKAIQVRYRKSGEVDIFLLDLPSNDGRGCFFLTSTHGHLLNAADFNDAPEEIKDAHEQFEHELGFWKHWQREKLKWPAKQ